MKLSFELSASYTWEIFVKSNISRLALYVTLMVVIMTAMTLAFAQKNYPVPSGGSIKLPSGGSFMPFQEFMKKYGYSGPGGGMNAQQARYQAVMFQRRYAQNYIQTAKQKLPQWKAEATQLQGRIPSLQFDVNAARTEAEAATTQRRKRSRELVALKQESPDDPNQPFPTEESDEVKQAREVLAEATRVESSAKRNLENKARLAAGAQAKLNKTQRTIAEVQATIPKAQAFLNQSNGFLNGAKNNRNRNKGSRRGKRKK